MGNDKKTENKSRRWFLTGGLMGDEAGKEKVKMLTADGKLVEVEKRILDAIAGKQKATNKEIYDWMKNPSKENNS
jgi:hypothetical protein